MSLREHFSELKRRAKVAFVSFAILFVAMLAVPADPSAVLSAVTGGGGTYVPLIAFFLARVKLELLPPGWTLIGLNVNSALEIYLIASLIFAVIFNAPIFAYEVIMFINPGLKENERKLIYPFIGAATGLFIVGILFGFFFLAHFLLIALSPFFIVVAGQPGDLGARLLHGGHHHRGNERDSLHDTRLRLHVDPARSHPGVNLHQEQVAHLGYHVHHLRHSHSRRRHLCSTSSSSCQSFSSWSSRSGWEAGASRGRRGGSRSSRRQHPPHLRRPRRHLPRHPRCRLPPLVPPPNRSRQRASVSCRPPSVGAATDETLLRVLPHGVPRGVCLLSQLRQGCRLEPRT